MPWQNKSQLANKWQNEELEILLTNSRLRTSKVSYRTTHNCNTILQLPPSANFVNYSYGELPLLKATAVLRHYVLFSLATNFFQCKYPAHKRCVQDVPDFCGVTE